MQGKKLESKEDLDNLRKSILSHSHPDKPFIALCSGTGCSASGGGAVADALRKKLKAKKLDKKVDVRLTGCHGFCERGPLVVIHPSGIFYHNVKPEDVPEIISETIIGGKPVDRLLFVDPATGEKIVHEKDVPFYAKQNRILLGNNGIIDPTIIEEYIGVGGYAALAKVLTSMKPEEVIDEVKKSGLRGRGGAGFPTGMKWELAKAQKGEPKYVVCNADEGDPGAYMNRSLLEGDPHSVLEGMLIGAYVIGSSEGFVYVRHEYPLAVRNVKIAIDQMRKRGLLGKNILGSKFSFDIKVVQGAGAFICGEETALMASIEGKKGEPRQRPPFPAERGIWGKPTNINNVETWANVPLIINNGAEWYSKIGTPKSRGTKIFSLVGKINNTGLVEVPLGIPLKEMIYDIGGGIPKDKKFKAVQSGGPSGGCIPADRLSLPIDYENLKEIGAIMGSGGMVVMDEDTCMVDVAKYFLSFLLDESCGKCMTCREGLERLLEITTDITDGKGKEEDMQTLKELGTLVQEASMCGLGQTAPNSLLSTIRFFGKEYDEHIKYKRCTAAVCKEIISSPCQHTCPIGTEAPLYISLIAKGRYKEAFNVIRKDNPLPSICGRVCSHPCERKCQAGKVGDPIAIRALKRFATDYAMKKGWKYPIEKQPAKNKKVAIVGAGPAGLTAGYYLAIKGYDVKILESLPMAGGALAVCIPEYRLPKEMLNYDIQNIKDAGVKIQTGVTVGKDISFDQLRNTYDAIYIATGAHESLKLGIPDEDADGVMDSMEFLRNASLGKKTGVGKRIGVIGGGNAAVDAARVASRLPGSDKVTLIYRRTRKEMPAFAEEVESCLEEGVSMQMLTMPKRVVKKDGKVVGLECVKMKLGEIDESGRRRPIPVEKSEFTIDLDTILIAIGEQPNTAFLDGVKGLEKSEKRNTIKVDSERYTTGLPGVFAGGDVITGPNTVIEAMGSGKVVANMIDRYLQGKTVVRDYSVTRPSMYVEPEELSEEEVSSAKRPKMKCAAMKVRNGTFGEVELGLTQEEAVKEAKRCLRCDLETEEGKAQFEKKEAKR